MRKKFKSLYFYKLVIIHIGYLQQMYKFRPNALFISQVLENHGYLYFLYMNEVQTKIIIIVIVIFLFIFLIGNGSNTNVLRALRDVLASSQLGGLLNTLFEDDDVKESALMDYLHDFLHMSYKPTLDIEMQVKRRRMFDTAIFNNDIFHFFETIFPILLPLLADTWLKVVFLYTIMTFDCD